MLPSDADVVRRLAARVAELEGQLERAVILGHLVENSQDELVYLDRTFKIIHVNGAYSDSCRKAPRQLVGRNYFELYPDAETQAVFERVRDTAEPAVWRETPFTFHDQPGRGTTYWNRTLAPAKDPTGAVVGLVLSLRDVTETVRGRQRLEESEQRFRLMADGAPSMVWVTDADGDLKFANRFYREFLGVTYREVAGGQWQSVIHPDDMAAYIGEVQAVLRERRPFYGEARIRRADGAWRWVSSHAEPRRSADGEFLGYVGISSDVTERKEAENALRESEGRFRSLFENLLDGYAYCEMLCDEQGSPVDFVYLEVNAAFERLTGLRGVVGRRATEIFPDLRQSEPELIATYARVASTGRSERFEIYFKPLQAWLTVSVYSPRRNHFVAVFDNITERKRAELELERLVEALRDADRRRTEFLAVLSHELRNPLTPIRNSVYILEHASPGGDQARRAQSVIDRQSMHMAQLIEDLLDVTRISRGKLELHRERVDLNDLAERTVEDHRSLFTQNGVQLDLHAASGEVWVMGDKTRLAQILGNLLQNAGKFTPRGGTASVAVEQDVRGGQAVITVADTGSGIDPEMIPRLFQPFAQAETTLDRSKGGLGLGLALVKGLAEMHGGTVSVESPGSGHGATFRVTLPLDMTAAAEMPTSQDACLRAPRRVLVIEDNSDAADSLREALALCGHDVDVACGGLKGIQAARGFEPDVVLCDIGLPDIDGYAVARTMRADPALSRVALVALTGYAQPEDVARAREAGFDAHVVKPPRLEVLEQLLADLGSRPARGPESG